MKNVKFEPEKVLEPKVNSSHGDELYLIYPLAVPGTLWRQGDADMREDQSLVLSVVTRGDYDLPTGRVEESPPGWRTRAWGHAAGITPYVPAAGVGSRITNRGQSHSGSWHLVGTFAQTLLILNPRYKKKDSKPRMKGQYHSIV